MLKAKVFIIASLVSSLNTSSFCFDLPAGLRPAKALGENEEPIVPNGSQAALENARTPPNLSLRSRMIAALNSRSSDSNTVASNSENNGENASSAQKASASAPVVFHKGGRKSRKSSPSGSGPVNGGSGDNGKAASTTSGPTVPPPLGKNYGVRTNLLTNLVDSKGRIIKGVNSIPIRVPSSSELRNAKSSRASASQVETDAEKIVPVKFGRAEQRRFNRSSA